MKKALLPVLMIILAGCAVTSYSGKDITTTIPVQPGPSIAGLRLRFIVETKQYLKKDIFHIRVDLLNVTEKPIAVSADWPYDQNEGDFAEYCESAVSIQTYPKIMFWGIQVAFDDRKRPQPKYTLGAKESLTVKWTAKGRRLKDKLVRPLTNMNPYFPSDGLYSVHAELLLHVKGKPGFILLRSNEQLVPVGGSYAIPKHSIGRLLHVSKDHKTASISLGSLHNIKTGDQFLIRKAFGYFWRLTVTETQLRSSETTLKFDHIMEHIRKDFPAHAYPKRGDHAGLIPKNVSHNKWMNTIEMKFYLAGTFKKHKKEDLNKLIEEAGHKVVGSIDISTDCVVLGYKDISVAKQKAVDMGTLLMNEEQLLKYLNK